MDGKGERTRWEKNKKGKGNMIRVIDRVEAELEEGEEEEREYKRGMDDYCKKRKRTRRKENCKKENKM